MTDKDKVLEEIQKRAFNFLMDHTNYNEKEKGYGLTLDHNENPIKSSIAATGFTLSAYIIGTESGYVDRKEALYKTKKTLETLLNNVSHYKGFFSHFVLFHTGERYQHCEYSTIDTMLCLKGVLSVEEYFKDNDITILANKIYDRIDWNAFIFNNKGKMQFRMSYNPNQDGDYVEDKPGFIHQWSMLAEQIPMYILAAGSNKLSKQLSLELYEGFERKIMGYGGYDFYYSPGNSLFVYQYPLCWLDGKNWVDRDNISYFENLRKATLAQYAWNLDNYKKYQTYSEHTFGLTASYTPQGYKVFEALPSIKNEVFTNGTVQPNAMIGSLLTNPDLVLKAVEYMLSLPNVWTEYGFVDGYNFEENKKWYSKRFMTIDKGLELLMVNAYLKKDVVHAFMNNKIIKRGLEVLEWKKISNGGKNL